MRRLPALRPAASNPRSREEAASAIGIIATMIDIEADLRLPAGVGRFPFAFHSVNEISSMLRLNLSLYSKYVSPASVFSHVSGQSRNGTAARQLPKPSEEGKRMKKTTNVMILAVLLALTGGAYAQSPGSSAGSTAGGTLPLAVRTQAPRLSEAP